ncbi:hypothetical protein SLA2020_488030 [Shorea laevis]
MASFRSALASCRLSDLGFRGPRYTWNNGRKATQFTKERLDRATANIEWCSLFRDMEVTVLAARTSDHNPLWVRFFNLSCRRTYTRSFKYEAKWDLDAECGDLLRNVGLRMCQWGIQCNKYNLI